MPACAACTHLPSFCLPLTSTEAEQREPFKDNTVRVASGLQRNGGLRSLLALVLTVRRCHSGEAFVRLKVRRAVGLVGW